MINKWIDLSTEDNKSFSGYLALPPSGKGPAVVLIQEIWGVNPHIQALAECYALAGFVVLAPDVFWRAAPRISLAYDAAGSAQAFECYEQLDTDQAAADIALAVRLTRALPAVCGKVATLGYCLGGQLAYRGGIAGEADTIVAYYGGGIDRHLDLASQLRQPALFHHAGKDSHISQEQVAAVKAAMVDKPQVRFFDYPAAEHGFNCWGRPAYRQADAALALGRSLSFLATHCA